MARFSSGKMLDPKSRYLDRDHFMTCILSQKIFEDFTGEYKVENCWINLRNNNHTNIRHPRNKLNYGGVIGETNARAKRNTKRLTNVNIIRCLMKTDSYRTQHLKICL